VHLRAGLDDLEKRNFLTLPVLELRSLGRPAAIPTTLSRLTAITCPGRDVPTLSPIETAAGMCLWAQIRSAVPRGRVI
jgi:hypothetical protein